MDNIKNFGEQTPVPASDEEMRQAVNDGVALLVPLLDKCARGMFLSSRNLPEQSTDMYVATVALAAISASFLGRLNEMAVEHGSEAGDIVEEYMAVLLPMLARVSPHVVDIGGSRAFEEFLAKEMSVPKGVTKQ